MRGGNCIEKINTVQEMRAAPAHNNQCPNYKAKAPPLLINPGRLEDKFRTLNLPP